MSAPLRAPNTYACCSLYINTVWEGITSQIQLVDNDPLCSIG